MKNWIVLIFSLLLLISCSNKISYEKENNYYELTESEALTGFKYIEIKNKRYVFNQEKAEKAGVSEKVIIVLSKNVKDLNTYLENENYNLEVNKDSIGAYFLRLTDFQKINEDNLHSDHNSIYQDYQLK